MEVQAVLASRTPDPGFTRPAPGSTRTPSSAPSPRSFQPPGFPSLRPLPHRQASPSGHLDPFRAMPTPHTPHCNPSPEPRPAATPDPVPWLRSTALPPGLVLTQGLQQQRAVEREDERSQVLQAHNCHVAVHPHHLGGR